MRCHTVLAKRNTGVLDCSIGVKQPPAYDADFGPCQLTAEPRVPPAGKAYYIVIEKHQYAIFGRAVDTCIVYLAPIEGNAPVNDACAFESFLDLGKAEARPSIHVAVHDHNDLDAIPIDGMAAEAGYQREYHINARLGRNDHRNQARRIVLPKDFDRVFHRAADGVLVHYGLCARLHAVQITLHGTQRPIACCLWERRSGLRRAPDE